jgi:hypothetical protein
LQTLQSAVASIGDEDVILVHKAVPAQRSRHSTTRPQLNQTRNREAFSPDLPIAPSINLTHHPGDSKDVVRRFTP